MEDSQYDIRQSEPQPTLPEMRTYAVRRDRLDDIYVTAHSMHFADNILVFQVLEFFAGSLMSRTVRAFSSWVDAEIVPVVPSSTLTN